MSGGFTFNEKSVSGNVGICQGFVDEQGSLKQSCYVVSRKAFERYMNVLGSHLGYCRRNYIKQIFEYKAC